MTITPEKLLAQNLRVLRLTSGQQALALKIEGGYTSPLILDVTLSWKKPKLTNSTPTASPRR